MKNLVLLAVALILYHIFHNVILNLCDKNITKLYKYSTICKLYNAICKLCKP